MGWACCIVYRARHAELILCCKLKVENVSKVIDVEHDRSHSAKHDCS